MIAIALIEFYVILAFVDCMVLLFMDNNACNDYDPNRRDFVVLTACSVAVVGVAACAVPILDTFNPSAAEIANSTTEVDLSDVLPGNVIVVKCQGAPVFIRHRTEEEIKELDLMDITTLIDPKLDTERTQPGHREWLIVKGICTHLGCVPNKMNSGIDGSTDGWVCPCHGSRYDKSGRVIHGPAPRNLEVPPYYFTGEKQVVIGRASEEEA